MSLPVPPPNGFRTFVIVWVTQSISVIGSALTFFAMNIWLVQVLYPLPTQKQELSWALSAVSLAFAVPTLLFAPIAGAWADRHDRKRTMIVMDFANGLFSIALVALIVTGSLRLWTLLIGIALFSSAGTFHNAAFDTSYAMLVPAKQLPRANGMMQTIWSLSGIVSPAIAATLITLPGLARQGRLFAGLNAALAPLKDGTALAIGLDAVTFFIASATLLFLFIPSPRREDLHHENGEKKSVWADVKEGARYIWVRKPLLWLLGTFTVGNFVAGPLGIFIPLLIKFNLASDWAARGFSYETALALTSTFEGIGGVAGGVFVSAWGGLKKNRVYGVLGGMAVAAAAQIALGFSNLLYLTAAMILVMAATIPMMNAHSQTIWQTQVPVELQGRVFAVRRTIAQFTWPVSTALAGWAGGLFDPGAVFGILGAILLVFVIFQFFNPYLRRIEDKAWLDGMAEKSASATPEN